MKYFTPEELQRLAWALFNAGHACGESDKEHEWDNLRTSRDLEFLLRAVGGVNDKKSVEEVVAEINAIARQRQSEIRK